MQAQIALSPHTKKPKKLLDELKKGLDKQNIRKGGIEDIKKLLGGKMKDNT